MAYKEPVIPDDVVLEPKLPRPSICLTGVATTSTRLSVVARREVRLVGGWPGR